MIGKGRRKFTKCPHKSFEFERSGRHITSIALICPNTEDGGTSVVAHANTTSTDWDARIVTLRDGEDDSTDVYLSEGKAVADLRRAAGVAICGQCVYPRMSITQVAVRRRQIAEERRDARLEDLARTEALVALNQADAEIARLSMPRVEPIDPQAE